MKKLLLLLALAGGLTAAQAQQNIQLMNNGNTFNNGDTIRIDASEEDIAEQDYTVLVFLQVKNNDSESHTLTLTTHMINSVGVRVQSVCSTTCAEGETCPPFSVDANAVSSNVFPEYVVDPAVAQESVPALASLTVNDASDNSEYYSGYLALTYHPTANGISRANKISVKVYPNPTTDMLNIASEDVDEIILTDMSGKTVMHQQVSGNARIDMSGIEAGMYVLSTVKNGQINGTQKVVVR